MALGIRGSKLSQAQVASAIDKAPKDGEVLPANHPTRKHAIFVLTDGGRMTGVEAQTFVDHYGAKLFELALESAEKIAVSDKSADETPKEGDAGSTETPADLVEAGASGEIAT